MLLYLPQQMHNHLLLMGESDQVLAFKALQILVGSFLLPLLTTVWLLLLATSSFVPTVESWKLKVFFVHRMTSFSSVTYACELCGCCTLLVASMYLALAK